MAAATASAGRRADPVTGVLEQNTTPTLDLVPERLVKGRKRSTHRVWILLPTTSRPLDIGEQEGHEASRCNRHLSNPSTDVNL